MKTRPLTVALSLLTAWLFTGCGKSEPTQTFPLSWCQDQATGQWQHQHRSAYTTVMIVNKVPITQYHPPRDWDEQLYVRRCALKEWRTDRRGPE